ncbi:MAG: hypothetical protein U5L45_21865 [Saprospiraceae bacterium]|nr:hypothetical protein [Saprospiraceae bacterium]
MVHFSGFARKMNHILPSRERSERRHLKRAAFGGAGSFEAIAQNLG